LDETNDPGMIVAAPIAILVLLMGWPMRPQPAPRERRRRSLGRRRMILIVAVIVGAALLLSPVATVAASALTLVWRRRSGGRRRDRDRRQIAADFPDALDLLVLSIRAGYLPAQAVVEIEPFLPPRLRRAFRSVNCSMQQGQRFADALGQLPAALGPVAQPLVDSLSAAERYGLPLAPVLERLSTEARQQRRRDADAAARELPVRLAIPLVLCTLPSFVLLAIVPLLLGALSSLHT